MEPGQEEALQRCPFNASVPLVMIIHGWSVRGSCLLGRERALLAATSVRSLHAAEVATPELGVQSFLGGGSPVSPSRAGGAVHSY